MYRDWVRWASAGDNLRIERDDWLSRLLRKIGIKRYRTITFLDH